MLRGSFIEIDLVIVVVVVAVVLLSSTCWDSKVSATMPVKHLRATLYCYNVTLQRQFNFHPASVYGVTSLSVI